MSSIWRGSLAAARLHLRAARRRPAASVAAIASVAAAVTLGVSVWVVTDSISTGVARVARLAGRATFEISGPGTGDIQPESVDAVAGVEGVVAAVPLVRSTVEIGGRLVPVLGVDARVEALGGDLDAATSSQFSDVAAQPSRYLDGVFVGAKLADRLDLRTGERSAITNAGPPLEILGVIRGGPLARIDGGSFVLGLLPVAEQLAGHPGRADAIEVVTEPGTDLTAVADRISAVNSIEGTGLSLSSPRLRAAEAQSYILHVQAASFVLVAVALIGGAIIAAVAVSILVASRREQLVLLTRLGAPATTVRAAVIAHALVIGTSGSMAGLAAGTFIADRIVAALPALPVASIDIAYSTHHDRYTPLITLGAGVVAALGAALWTLRPRRTDIPRRFHRRQRPSVTAAAVERWGGPAGVPIALAHRRRAARWAAIGAASSVGMSIIIAALAADVDRANHAMTRSWRDVDVVVQTSRLGDPPTGPAVPPALVARLTDLAVVTRVVADQLVYVSDGRQDFRVEAVGMGSATPIVKRAPADARKAIDAGGGVAVSRWLAHRDGLHVGSSFSLPTPHGEEQLPVVAVTDVPEPAVALSLERFTDWFARSGATRLEIDTDTPAATTTVLAAARAEGMIAATGTELAAASARPLAAVSTGLRAIGVIALALAAAGLTLGSVLEGVSYHDAVARLSRLGASKGMLRRARFVQQLATMVGGAAVGAAVALAVTRGAEAVLARVSGLPLSSGTFPCLAEALAAGGMVFALAAASSLAAGARSVTSAALPRPSLDSRQRGHHVGQEDTYESTASGRSGRGIAGELFDRVGVRR